MITITRPLNYNVVESLTITSVEKSTDGTKLIVFGTDPDGIPIRIMVYVGHPVAEEIVYSAIFGQLKDYRSFKNGTEAFKALQKHTGDTIQVKLIREEYEDPITEQKRLGTKTILNPAEF